MFSFHKPKIYRSISGCCICRAKSSSSRFTDSKRYEMDFMECFGVSNRSRAGEICNACVLLIKRWKKLEVGSTKNWNHVVDARAGPGIKSITKLKMKCKEDLMVKKHKHFRRRVQLQEKPPCSPGGLSDDVAMGDEYLSDEPNPTYLGHSDGSDDECKSKTKSSSNQRKSCKPSKAIQFSSFLDLTYWKEYSFICSGVAHL